MSIRILVAPLALSAVLVSAPVRADATADAHAAAPTQVAPAPSATPAAAPSTSAAAQPSAPAKKAADPAEESVEKPKRNIAPVIVMGVGGATLLTGLFFLAAANQQESEAQTLGDTADSIESVGSDASDLRASAADDRRRADSYRGTGYLAVGAGALIAGAGLVWFVIDRQNSQNPAKSASAPHSTAGPIKSLSLAPLASPAGGGALLRGTF